MPAHKLPEEARRSKYVGCRLTPWQYGVLERAAAINEKTVGELVAEHIEELISGLDLAEQTQEEYTTTLTLEQWVGRFQSQLRRIAHNMDALSVFAEAPAEQQERSAS